jgi:hypothetical protein
MSFRSIEYQASHGRAGVDESSEHLCDLSEINAVNRVIIRGSLPKP